MYLLSLNNCHSSKNNKLINIRRERTVKIKTHVKKNFPILFKIFAVVSISIFLLLAMGLATSSHTRPEIIVVEVVGGDNLWKIADRYYDDENDLRKKIFKIKKINRLETAMLQPGQKLEIPIEK